MLSRHLDQLKLLLGDKSIKKEFQKNTNAAYWLKSEDTVKGQ